MSINRLHASTTSIRNDSMRFIDHSTPPRMGHRRSASPIQTSTKPREGRLIEFEHGAPIIMRPWRRRYAATRVGSRLALPSRLLSRYLASDNAPLRTRPQPASVRAGGGWRWGLNIAAEQPSRCPLRRPTSPPSFRLPTLRRKPASSLFGPLLASEHAGNAVESTALRHLQSKTTRYGPGSQRKDAER